MPPVDAEAARSAFHRMDHPCTPYCTANVRADRRERRPKARRQAPRPSRSKTTRAVVAKTALRAARYSPCRVPTSHLARGRSSV